MQKPFEAPELMLIGEAGEVVMGLSDVGDDYGNSLGWDFEFEQD